MLIIYHLIFFASGFLLLSSNACNAALLRISMTFINHKKRPSVSDDAESLSSITIILTQIHTGEEQPVNYLPLNRFSMKSAAMSLQPSPKAIANARPIAPTITLKDATIMPADIPNISSAFKNPKIITEY